LGFSDLGRSFRIPDANPSCQSLHTKRMDWTSAGRVSPATYTQARDFCKLFSRREDHRVTAFHDENKK